MWLLSSKVGLATGLADELDFLDHDVVCQRLAHIVHGKSRHTAKINHTLACKMKSMTYILRT
jgi:hypothetical protein